MNSCNFSILGNTKETLARADEGLRIANKHTTYYRSKLNLQLTKIEHLIQKEVSIEALIFYLFIYFFFWFSKFLEFSVCFVYLFLGLHFIILTKNPLIDGPKNF